MQQQQADNLIEGLQHSVAKYGNAVAINGLQGDVSFQQFAAVTDRVAAALAAAGLRSGDRVGLYCVNSEAYAIAYFGIIKCGAIAVPVNLLLPPTEISYILNDAEVSMLIYHQLFRETVASLAVPSLRQRIVIGDVATGDDTSLAACMAATGQAPAIKVRPAEDVACIIYTSGTTGRPKGAMLTHRNLMANANSCRHALQPQAGRDAYLVVLPMFHSFAHMVGMLVPLLSGCRFVPVPKFDVQLVADTIARNGATVFMGVPTMFAMLLTLPPEQTGKLATLRYCIAGGSAMPLPVMEKFEQRFTALIYEGDGPSECSPVTCVNPIGGQRKPGSVGPAVLDVSMEIRDADGKKVVDGEIGEICVRGPNVMPGYWRRPKETAEVFFGDWYRTGDLGYRDTDGYFYIVDRLKDMIIINGMNVYPKMVEDVLYRMPHVKDVAVVGQPDDLHGEVPVAYMVADTPGAISADDVAEFCKDKLAGYQTPRTVIFMDALPRTPTGKVLKRELSKRGDRERGIKS